MLRIVKNLSVELAKYFFGLIQYVVSYIVSTLLAAILIYRIMIYRRY